MSVPSYEAGCSGYALVLDEAGVPRVVRRTAPEEKLALGSFPGSVFRGDFKEWFGPLEQAHSSGRLSRDQRLGSEAELVSRMVGPPATRRRGAGVMQDIKVPREHRLKLEEDSAANKGGKTQGPRGGHEGG